MTTRLSLSPKPFLIGHCFNQWDRFCSVYKPARYYLHFILTISLEECQTTSFGMNVLLHAALFSLDARFGHKIEKFLKGIKKGDATKHIHQQMKEQDQNIRSKREQLVGYVGKVS